MLDFVDVKVRSTKRGNLEVYPEFKAVVSKDLMIRGGVFYAIWDEERGFWSKDEMTAIRLIDDQIFKYGEQLEGDSAKSYVLLREFSSHKLLEWQQYCKTVPDHYNELDSKVIFQNDEVKKEDYATFTLPYSISNGKCEAYDELMSTLYDPEERLKLEWAIGSIIAGDSKWIQKFIVLFGGQGTGKSTFLKIVERLFEGYCSSFESEALGNRSNAFALEMFRHNPLIGIEQDGDLHRIETNTRINSIVSHEKMVINEKYKSPYNAFLKTFMFIGTNKPVKITDAKSGILRRLIDVNPSGRKVPFQRYNILNDQIKFELGAIANRCLETYKELGSGYYNSYVPKQMLSATNDTYNFIVENYDYFVNNEQVPLSAAWLRYNNYVTDSKITYPLPKRAFKEELKNYFEEFFERKDGSWNIFKGFLKEKVDVIEEEKIAETNDNWIVLKEQPSIFDQVMKDAKAQYANSEDSPRNKWDKVTTTLQKLDTSKIHYVKPPDSHIVIDLDLKDEDGNKSLKKNLEEASKWPKTYVEVSKGGGGLHLHYDYEGDTTLLSNFYDKHIEIKKFSGGSSLRRRLSKCNDIPIAKINSGLPLKRSKNMISEYTIQSEKKLREMIEKNLRKEIHQDTSSSIDFIHKLLNDAYESGMKYDVTDMRSAIQSFAMNSTNQADRCLRVVSNMKFQSEEPTQNNEDYGDAPIVFFDIECFPNLFLVVAKKQGTKEHMVFVNPKPEEMEALVKNRLIGFNNRNYDNHMIYGCMMGYNTNELYELSQSIIKGEPNSKFGEAYNLSYTDVYDFLSPANKMGLKKWEIKLGIHHQELGLPWDEPISEGHLNKVIIYCCYDVDATEAVFESKEGQADWTARKILAKLSGLTRNDTTNSHTKRIIVGTDKHPQDKFVYTDLSTIFPGYKFDPYGIPKEEYIEGAKIVQGKSWYMGEDPSEGGYVYAEPGIYYHSVVLDIGSMHPYSIIELNLFGDEYTKRFKDIVEARIHVKHKEYDQVRDMLDGKLSEFLGNEEDASGLALGLKGAINPVYGLTSARFENALKDPRNKDNIVAKRGALFMITLKYEVQKLGYKVIHIKTDSIKIADADPFIIKFVMDFGKKYGYTFEHEATYEKMCLINDSTYIAKYEDCNKCETRYGYIPGDNEKHSNEWTATGDRFQVPFVFKTLFSKDEIKLSDLVETKSVSTAIYLDMNEKLPDVSDLEKEHKKLTDQIKRGEKTEEECADTLCVLEKEIEKGHDYRFVGKIGAFVPVIEGSGGGILLRKGNNGKYGAVEGTKKKGSKSEVFRWMEDEMVKKLGLEDHVDYEYYQDLAGEAIEKIEQFGDFEQFVNEDAPAFRFKVQDGDSTRDFVNVPDHVNGDEAGFEEYMNEPEELPFL